MMSFLSAHLEINIHKKRYGQEHVIYCIYVSISQKRNYHIPLENNSRIDARAHSDVHRYLHLGTHFGNYRSKGYQLSISTRQKYDQEIRHKVLGHVRTVHAHPHFATHILKVHFGILRYSFCCCSLFLLCTPFDGNHPPLDK